MQVGVNYPWFDYGWDFGRAPLGWRDERPRWLDVIDADLAYLDGLGISVVRWFVLGDGLTYGIGDEAPWEDGTGWHFVPPPAPEEIGCDFELLLSAIDRFNDGRQSAIQLLPVLFDYQFALPGHPIERTDGISGAPDGEGWVKRGRHEAIAVPSFHAALLTATLDPLLAIAQRYPGAIYAWEPINEPEWITSGWHPDGGTDHPVTEPAMRALVEDASARIRTAGFKPTIGFALPETLSASHITAEINQFHHYPGGLRRLPRHAFDPRFPGIIGEMATRPTDVWPELIAQGQSTINRLRRAETQGYPLALLWSFRQRDRHGAWTPEVESDVKTFTR